MAQLHMQWPPKSRSRWASYVSNQYHWIPLSENPKKVVVCKYCAHVMAYNISRLRSHLIGEKVGTGKTGVVNGRQNKVSDNISRRDVPIEIKQHVSRLFGESVLVAALEEMSSPDRAMPSNEQTQASSSRPIHVPVIVHGIHATTSVPFVPSNNASTTGTPSNVVGMESHARFQTIHRSNAQVRSNSGPSSDVQANIPD